MNTGLGLIPPAPLSLSGNLLKNWNNFKEEFKIYLTGVEAYGQSTEKVKIALFLNLIGKEAYELHKNKVVLYPDNDSGRGITHKMLISGFDTCFKSCHRSVIYNSFKFEQRKQENGEPFDDFLLAIFQMAEKCKFFDNFERRIRDKIVAGINDSNLRMKLMSLEDQSLDGIVEHCREVERQKNMNKLSKLKLNEVNEFFLYKKIFNNGRHLKDDSDISRRMSYPSSVSGSSRQDKHRAESSGSNENNDEIEERSDSQDNALNGGINSQNRVNEEVVNEGRPSRTKRANRSYVDYEVLDMDDPEWESPNPKKKNEQGNKSEKKSRKRFDCTDCNKNFISLKNFKNHRKFHTGKGLHKCEICNKPYLRKGHLLNHMKIHKSE